MQCLCRKSQPFFPKLGPVPGMSEAAEMPQNQALANADRKGLSSFHLTTARSQRKGLYLGIERNWQENVDYYFIQGRTPSFILSGKV